MGGHGALTVALKNPGKYASVSAFSPISNPSAGLWGQKALTGYIGSDRSSWADWDATLLAKTYSGPEMEILIDQVNFYKFCKNTIVFKLIGTNEKKTIFS
ncbi:unnamed protein product [Larinioides sclopetarius]|uniref:S-formylglutathione hydrolase n=1 Tax=Larinioides sclopetarius TaxID=280406 RepID=A0AAV1ZAZ9_9ARAC